MIGVTADGNLELKSFYSSYGVGKADVIAPGGDSILQLTAACAERPRPLDLAGLAAHRHVPARPPSSSTPAGRRTATSRARRWRRHTLPAWRHLIVSQGITNPGAVAARIFQTAQPMACPSDLSIYAFFPSVSNGAPQTCDGGLGHNGFNGHGELDALAAVS